MRRNVPQPVRLIIRGLVLIHQVLEAEDMVDEIKYLWKLGLSK